LNSILLFALALAMPPTAISVPAPAEPVVIPNSNIYSFHSAVNDSDYRLFIILPRSYATSTRHYPVFYLLDGNDTATIAWLTRSRQHSDMAEVIFVGIGYPEPLAGPPVPLPGKPAVPTAQRSADYATVNTTEPWSPPTDKGAPVFLDVIRREIIPYIDTHYRTDPQHRTLGGHSLGGLFTTYALFHAAESFDKFWIGSPSLLWDKSVMFRNEQEYAATHHDLNARVIADVGGQESKTFMRDPLFAMMNKVQSRKYPHMVWKTIVLPNEDHGTLPIAGMPQVIDYLFGPPSIALTPQQSQTILGDWQLPDGKTIHFAYDGDLLFATGLPFLSNTAPAKEQLITPLTPDTFLLRTMLNLTLKTDAAGHPKLLIHKMRSDDFVEATRPRR
jgi:predicted alpha/beta superfamily hydrolase